MSNIYVICDNCEKPTKSEEINEIVANERLGTRRIKICGACFPSMNIERIKKFGKTNFNNNKNYE
jgi:hypothetical protein